MEKCVACQFYDRDDVHGTDKAVRWGKCRRTGPIVHPVTAKSYIVEGVWPSVRDDDWCGEWSPSKRRMDAAAAGAMSSLLMQSASPSMRPAASAGVSLMVPLSSSPPASDVQSPPGSTRLGSD